VADVKQCCECGRLGTKAFSRKTQDIGGYESKLWRCSNTRRCGERGLDLKAALETRRAAFEQAAGRSSTLTIRSDGSVVLSETEKESR
jgi:hypothetical protein